jgi:Trk K+ transport system NAD-binding subunit
VERPIVLCGLGRMGTKVLEYLEAARLPVVVVDNTCRPDDPRLRGARLVAGDCRRREVLEAAGVAKAGGVLILTADDLLNISTALAVRSLNPQVRIVVRMFNQHLIGRLGQTLYNVYALSTSLLVAPILALAALTGQALATFCLDGHPEGRRQIVEIPIGPASTLAGRTIAGIIGPRGATAVAHLAPGADGARWRLLLDVDVEATLQAGDRLVVCGEPHTLTDLLAAAGEDQLPDLLWAGWFRRMARVVRRTLADIDRPVLVCGLLLVIVLVGSTLILRIKFPALNHAFLRTIGIIATAAALPVDENDWAGLEVFVSVLRISGVLLMAAFTAIFTNYLLRARLRGAFELRRIPERGHHIVCGVGTVGFRVIEELIRYGEQVVGIERNPDSRFISTARRLGAAVIVGDAGVTEVLRQANAATAHSVIAATNNDLTNLAVALEVRQTTLHHRVVLLLSDPQFAQMMRDAARVQLAASVPVLAAPAFVAGLFGDRVLTLFQLGECLLAVLDLVIQEKDLLAGQTVRAIAVDYRLQPVALLPASGQRQWSLLAARLCSGDRLAVVINLADLEPLLRRRPASAEWAVDVAACPLPIRPWLAGLVRTVQGCGQEDADRIVAQLPMRLAAHLTRGQAEDLLAQLVRQRVTGRVVPVDGQPDAPTAAPAGQ